MTCSSCLTSTNPWYASSRSFSLVLVSASSSRLDAHSFLLQPFRRRGYERDGMLKTVVDRAGFAQIYASSQKAAGSKADGLATMPATLSHFALDALFERPVQAKLVELLLLPKDDQHFTNCVLVHGMGGTGKVSGAERHTDRHRLL